jgi:hypothetical protein
MEDEANRIVNAIYTAPQYLTSNAFQMSKGGKVVLTITNDGRLELGEGASADEATRVLFDYMAQCYGTMVHEMKEENKRLRETLKNIVEACEDVNSPDKKVREENLKYARTALKEGSDG